MSAEKITVAPITNDVEKFQHVGGPRRSYCDWKKFAACFCIGALTVGAAIHIFSRHAIPRGGSSISIVMSQEAEHNHQLEGWLYSVYTSKGCADGYITSDSGTGVSPMCMSFGDSAFGVEVEGDLGGNTLCLYAKEDCSGGYDSVKSVTLCKGLTIGRKSGIVKAGGC